MVHRHTNTHARSRAEAHGIGWKIQKRIACMCVVCTDCRQVHRNPEQRAIVDGDWRLFGQTEILPCPPCTVHRAHVRTTLARLLNASHKQLNINYLFCYSPKNYTDCAFVYELDREWRASLSLTRSLSLPLFDEMLLHVLLKRSRNAIKKKHTQQTLHRHFPLERYVRGTAAAWPICAVPVRITIHNKNTIYFYCPKASFSKILFSHFWPISVEFRSSIYSGTDNCCRTRIHS